MGRCQLSVGRLGAARYLMADHPQVILAAVVPVTQSPDSHEQALAILFAGSTTPPVITNISPAPGTPIDRDTTIRLDVVDLSGLLRSEITVKMSNEDDRIVVHDGDQFCGRFTNLSSRTSISDGFTYALKPNGGWKGSPNFKVHAVDTSGNEA